MADPATYGIYIVDRRFKNVEESVQQLANVSTLLVKPVYARVLTRVQLTSSHEPSSNPPMDVG